MSALEIKGEKESPLDNERSLPLFFSGLAFNLEGSHPRQSALFSPKDMKPAMR